MKTHIPVPYIDQSDCAPTGCECVSAVMLLRHLGIELTVDEFIDGFVEQAPFEERNGVLWGPDPRVVFAGSPRDPEGMGCWAPAMARFLQRALGDKWQVLDETGLSVPELEKRYINNGMPVLLWTTIDMREHIEGPDWRLYDSGSLFHWRSNEHCLLLVGGDENTYICNDPWNNNGIVSYDRALLEKRHEAQLRQSIGVVRRTNVHI